MNYCTYLRVEVFTGCPFLSVHLQKADMVKDRQETPTEQADDSVTTFCDVVMTKEVVLTKEVRQKEKIQNRSQGTDETSITQMDSALVPNSIKNTKASYVPFCLSNLTSPFFPIDCRYSFFVGVRFSLTNTQTAVPCATSASKVG